MEGFEMETKKSVTAEMVTSRQTQEVQGQIIMAKKFPRDEIAARNRILTACQRKRLAEQAEYEYKRGTSKVTGTSIRLAEAMAQNWGNLDFGFVELEQRNGESQVMAYCWDLETNTRQTKIFTVPHIRETKNGNYPLTSSRDIYETVANQAARRVRACILGIIPGDIQEEAVEQCRKTLVNGEEKPLEDLIKDCVRTAEKTYQVPQESLEKYIGCKASAFSMNDLIRLKRVFNSIKDGMSKREEIFELPGVEKKEVEDAFSGREKKEEKTADGQQELNLEGGADAETK
ncbi:MAG: hypothetical protein K2H52_13960 [Lachnospiraceae bacterium]|nr:hypothetical protein [Lachnospiraceae bacterium]